MDSAVKTIERVLETDLLMEELMDLPDRGATDAEIAEEERRVGRPLSAQHRALLKRWNGADLDEVRIAGCADDAAVDRISKLTEWLEERPDGAVCFGSDPAGFVYYETIDGRVWSFDHDGGEQEERAQDIDHFFGQLIFGPDAAEWGDEEWVEELRDAGLIP